MSEVKFDFSNTKDRKLYKILTPLGKLLTKIVYNVKFEGVENFPKEGGYIFASNHVVAVDPVYISTRVPQPVHFMGKQEAFSKAFGRWFLTNFNSFPVNRGVGDRSAIDYAIKLINDGRVLGIFPEGTREKDRKLGRPKSGIALIAKETKADILPVSIHFEDKPKFRAKVVVRYGKIIKYSDLGLENSEEKSSVALKSATRIVWERITELWEGSSFDY